jgi:pimeloyl-ACP methyl ester carboxylesterase
VTSILLAVLAGMVALAAAAWAHLRYWVRRLTLSLPYASQETLELPDGAHVELYRVPSAAPLGELPPVLLVHGLGANHRNQDLHPDFSLARHLATRGRDVWLLNLRSGLGRWTRREAALVRFDAMARHDVPLGVAAVLARTGAAQLDYVGFSMGGMLLYAALGRTLPAEQLRRAVIVGSPARISAPSLLLPLLRRVPRWMVPASRYKLLAHAAAFMIEWVKTPAHGIFYNPRNVSPGLPRAAMVNLVEDIPAPLNADFLSWVVADGDVRFEGARVVEGLTGIGVPALFFAGTADRMAPPASVRAAFDAWGKDREGVSKRLVVMGKDFGYRADYGHGDLAMGTHVVAELFAPIERFLGVEEAGEAIALLPLPSGG